MHSYSFSSSCPSQRNDNNNKRKNATRRSRSGHNVDGSENLDRPVLLFDVMDTIVHDPFYTKMPAHFGLTFEQVCCVGGGGGGSSIHRYKMTL